MTPEEIKALAIEAGAAKFYPDHQKASDSTYLVTTGFVERLVALVAARERRECLADLQEEANDGDLWPDEIEEVFRRRGRKESA